MVLILMEYLLWKLSILLRLVVLNCHSLITFFLFKKLLRQLENVVRKFVIALLMAKILLNIRKISMLNLQNIAAISRVLLWNMLLIAYMQLIRFTTLLLRFPSE